MTVGERVLAGDPDGEAHLVGLEVVEQHEVGATGVDYIAVGALTHSAPVLDVGADLRPL